MRKNASHLQSLRKRFKTRDAFRVLTIIFLILAFSFSAHLSGFGNRVGPILEWFRGLGYWAPLIFILIYVGATVAAIPRGVLTIIAGSLFGPVRGIVIVSIAATSGAALAFLVSRYMLRDVVSRWLGGSKKYQKLNALTVRHGGIVVALTRLTPIFPYNILNYGFGLTKVRFWTYLFWSWVCMLPWTILYVLGGDMIIQAMEEGQLSLGLLVNITLAGLVILWRLGKARKKWKVWKREKNNVE